jgi:hypothetical protein
MYPHDTHTYRAGVVLRHHVMWKVFMTIRRLPRVGPTRISVDWHFGQRPDLIPILLSVSSGSAVLVWPTAGFSVARSAAGCRRLSG